jgi:N-acetylglucosaminyl-diphospho-decaprenol L-rhamnosyltransferase
MTPSLSVIIVNFNSGEHLAACLGALVAHMPPVAWDAVVVDNASTDGSAGVVATYGDRVRLIRLADNVGFARAMNRGLAETRGELVLMLNPDCRLLPGAVARLMSELDRMPRCAVVGPQVVDEDGREQGSARGDPSLWTGFFGRTTLGTRLLPGSLLARRNVRRAAELPPGATSLEVDWVAGACLLARREALDAVGGFDERYFLYWEDADLCRRLRAHGYTVRYVPAARVVHAVGRSSRSNARAAIRAFHESAYLYYTTHIVPQRWHPLRALAWAILRARCWWKLLRASGSGRP